MFPFDKRRVNRQTSLKLIVAVVLTLLLPAGVAKAQGWIEDFESYTAGSFPSPPWTNSGNTAAMVEAGTGLSGSKSLKLNGVMGGCWGALAHRPIAVQPSVVIEAYVRNGAETLSGCHTSYGDVQLNTGPSWTTSGRALLMFDQDDSTGARIIRGLTSDVPANGPNLGPYVQETWYKVKIRYERVTPAIVRVSYWIDDVFKGSYDSAALSYENDLAYLSLQSAEGSAWFDNVSVSPGGPITTVGQFLLAAPETASGGATPGVVYLLTGTGTGPLTALPSIPSSLTNVPGYPAFSATGELFVSNIGAGSIARFRIDASGTSTATGTITGNNLSGVHGLAFSAAGELFAANLTNGTISRFRFDAQGTAVANGTIQTGGYNQGLAFSAMGELFNTDFGQHVRRFRFDPTTGAASANGSFAVPGASRLHGLAFNAQGELFIADPDNNRVVRYTFDGSGNPVSHGTLAAVVPIGVAFSPAGELFVSGQSGGLQRFLFDANGTAVSNGATAFDHLGGVAIYAASIATPDLVWQHATSGDVYLWTMNGMTQTGGAYLAHGMGPWKVVGTADLNGDGKPDLLWQHATSGDVYLWTMNGTSQTGGAYLTYGLGAWKIVATADLNGDGKPDLLWQDTTTGDVYVWFMNGTTVTSGSYLAHGMGAWKIVGTADLNGDGKPDLLWQHATSGDVYIWFMNGTTMTSGAYLTYGLGAWKIVATADLNGDGKPDLLWQDTTTGDVYVWFMNGTTVTSGAYLAHGMGPWKVVGPK